MEQKKHVHTDRRIRTAASLNAFHFSGGDIIRRCRLIC